VVKAWEELVEVILRHKMLSTSLLITAPNRLVLLVPHRSFNF